MLKLHELDISGFKTFVDPVSTRFSGGITAIVGPNGCGKSNFAEAVTWVLGEQSAKSLRSDTMEDVIFSGCETRRPVGMAEVNLTFLTDEEIEHAQDGRIIIGRRVFRSGESQYRINDRVVRLKDVKDLLMDTGLGIRAYSVIEQGKIGQILSGKPQERRKLIEEAAGITRYKARKRVAELKLEEATANLLRIDDIISEVERALRSLKRQANAAIRFQERQSEHRALLALVLQGEAAQLGARLDDLESRLEARRTSAAATGTELQEGLAGLTEARRRLDELGEELSSRHRRLAELAATIEGRQEFIKGATQTLQEIDERLVRGTTVAAERHREMEAHNASLAALDEKHRRLLEERSEAAEAVEADRRELTAAEEAVRLAEARLEELRSQMMSSIGRINALQNRLHKEQIETEKTSYRRDHLTGEIDQRRKEADEAAAALEEATTRAADLEARLDARRGQRQLVQHRLDEVLRQEAEANDTRESTQEELSSRRHRRTVLQELEEAEAQRRSNLERVLAELGMSEPRFLADEIQVPQGWEGSLDLFLEQLRDAVVVPAGLEPLDLARSLKAGRSHGTLVRPSSDGEAETERNGAPTDDAVLGSLGEALGLEPALATALPPAYLVRSVEDAQRLAPLHRGVAFLAQDRMWAQGGVLHLVGEKARPGALSRRRELADIERRVTELESILAEVDDTLDRLVDERTSLAGQANRLDEEIAELRQSLAVAQARHQDAASRHTRLEEDHRTLADEGRELDGTLALLDQRQLQLKSDLASAQERHGQLEATFDGMQAEVDAARERREALRTAGAGRRGRLELLEERVDSQGSEAQRLRRQSDDIRHFLDRWHDEEQTLTRRREELERGQAEARTQLEEALTLREQSEELARSGQEVLDGQREEVRRLEEEVEVLRSRRDDERTVIEELRVEEASRRQELEHLGRDYEEHFGEPLPQELPEVPEDLDELQSELARRKQVLEKMGPVNVLAAEEYTEQEERYRFLTEQRADVHDSVERLRRTIREINQTSSERFAATFTEVNENFARIFADLFRGGEAEMRLLDEDDPLDSGIEIMARPPGKRPQNIMLLSGGEKALGAIALLFALFQCKPSPFCILDEVDAPLDDANILRFVHTLREMARETQFLIITHNKLTMEVAGTLYGVTMEERGVSKLVAVDVEDLHPETAAASA